MLDKILKAFGSAFAVSLITGIIANIVGLKVEYTVFQPQQNLVEETKPVQKQVVIIDTIKTSNQAFPNVQMDNREIKIVSPQFAFSKHKWYVKLLGFGLIMFPFFYFPLSTYFEERKLSIQLTLRNLDDDFLGRHLRQKAAWSYLKEYLILYSIYLLIYGGALYFIFRLTDIEIVSFSVFLFERFSNFITGLF